MWSKGQSISEGNRLPRTVKKSVIVLTLVIPHIEGGIAGCFLVGRWTTISNDLDVFSLRLLRSAQPSVKYCPFPEG